MYVFKEKGGTEGGEKEKIRKVFKKIINKNKKRTLGEDELGNF